MIELPEALTYKKDLEQYVVGRTIARVYPPSSPHKFCWFNGEPERYHERLAGKRVAGADAFGIYGELELEDDMSLAFNDGVNVRLVEPGDKRPPKYQLMAEFLDGSALVFSVAMYGGIICHGKDYDNEYYVRSREGISPMDIRFNLEYFGNMMRSVKPSVSAKAFLATEQRIPGLGNGGLQDILFKARMHPKRKLAAWSGEDAARVFSAIKDVMADMTAKSGRDTEKDLLGHAGGYKTVMSKNTWDKGCSVCGGRIIKESYLGGAVYYCPVCQPLD